MIKYKRLIGWEKLVQLEILFESVICKVLHVCTVGCSMLTKVRKVILLTTAEKQDVLVLWVFRVLVK